MQELVSISNSLPLIVFKTTLAFFGARFLIDIIDMLFNTLIINVFLRKVNDQD